MKNLIFLSGINGSGKSTIGKKLSEKTGIPVFEGSSILMQHFGLIPGDYDALRAIPYEEQFNGNIEAFKQVSQNNKKAIAIGHFMLTIKGTTKPVIGDWFNDCFCLIHLRNEPEVILDRIEKDERDRKLFSESHKTYDEQYTFIKKTQEQSLESAEQVSKQYNVPLYVIENNDIDTTIEEIIKLI